MKRIQLDLTKEKPCGHNYYFMKVCPYCLLKRYEKKIKDENQK